MRAEIKQSVRIAYRGGSVSGEAGLYIQEYSTRKAMSALGYRSNFDELDAKTAECFMVIESELDKIRNQESKKHGRRKT